MNENELREAMRSTMTLTPPPPMESASALRTARRDVRRRATLTGAGAAVALVAVGTVAVPSVLHLGADGGSPAAAPAAVTATPTAAPTPIDAGENTKPAWPLDGDGQPQEDATARSGERYDQGRKLLTGVLAVVPDGWSTPTGTTSDDIPLQSHQAAVEEDNTGSVWGYMAGAAVRKNDRTGRILAEVHTKNNKMPTEPCDLAQKFWGMGGSCEVVTVGPAEVGVVTSQDSTGDFTHWAAYRHADGTVVFVAQGKRATGGRNAGLVPLEELPFTKQELAGLAVEDRFHLS
ncbi:hypothetical protein [Actinoplanes sp. NPDC051494]|uniref:hypothetical protein n=1 Tax=Actinoplanes sp. NPDC051494 TaxID=3363907 RepID=UPI0037B9F35B